jgi:hypothetical protein
LAQRLIDAIGKKIDDMASSSGRAFIHPTAPLNCTVEAELPYGSHCGARPIFTVDTTMAAMRLALSGVLSAHPVASIIIPRAGGMIRYLMGSLDVLSEVSLQPPTAIKRPGILLRKLYIWIRWCINSTN